MQISQVESISQYSVGQTAPLTVIRTKFHQTGKAIMEKKLQK